MVLDCSCSILGKKASKYVIFNEGMSKTQNMQTICYLCGFVDSCLFLDLVFCLLCLSPPNCPLRPGLIVRSPFRYGWNGRSTVIRSALRVFAETRNAHVEIRVNSAVPGRNGRVLNPCGPAHKLHQKWCKLANKPH